MDCSKQPKGWASRHSPRKWPPFSLVMSENGGQTMQERIVRPRIGSFRMHSASRCLPGAGSGLVAWCRRAAAVRSRRAATPGGLTPGSTHHAGCVLLHRGAGGFDTRPFRARRCQRDKRPPRQGRGARRATQGADCARQKDRRSYRVALVAPPSSRMFCPTMNPAFCEHRKAQAAPNSAAVP